MNNELDHLSYSSISTFLSCPANWDFKYNKHVPVKASPNLLFGSAWHETIESFIANKGKPDQPSLTGLWQYNWNKQTFANDQPREDINWKDETPELLCNLGIRMFEHPAIRDGILSITPAFRPDGNAAIETKVELRVPGVPIPIVGYIDIMTPEGVGDFKTSARSWTVDQAQKELQPIYYLAALNQMGIPVNSFSHYVFVKTKTPQFQKIVTTRKPSEMFFLFKMIQNVWKAIESGIFPLNPTGWKCDPDYCEYYSVCRGKYE